MKAAVFHGVGDIRLEEVPEPTIKEPTDAIVMIRGTFAGMEDGTILGHDGVGVVEQLGTMVRNLEVGDRVVIPSTIACGFCAYCRAGYFAQCDTVNPHGKRAGTAFFGGPATTGPFHGLQAERARIPYAHVGLVKLPDDVSDEQAILLSDIFPTGYFGAELAEIRDGDTVVVFGCGPVGQFAIVSAKLLAAGRIIAVDCLEDRLALARKYGAEIVNFEREDPVATIVNLTGGIGADRAIDAVGIDAVHPHRGPAAAQAQVLQWGVEALAKAGTLAIIGGYSPAASTFPIGQAMNRNLTIKAGNCNHRRYIPHLLDLVRTGVVDPTQILTQLECLWRNPPSRRGIAAA